VEFGEHGVGAVDLVAGGAEVLVERAEVGAAGGAVAQQPGGLGDLAGVAAGAGVDPQLGPQRAADRAGLGEVGQAAGGQVIDGALPTFAAAMPSRINGGLPGRPPQP
jgi:hypothetical protein